MTEYRSAPLTESALKPDVLRITITPFIRDLPTDAIGGSTKSELADRPLTLHWQELTTTADIPTKQGDRSTFRGFLRHRGELTRRIFADANAAPGDVVVIVRYFSFTLNTRLPKVTEPGNQPEERRSS